MKFKDAELIGVPTIVIVGRAWPTASSRSRTGAPASGEEVPLPEAVARITGIVRA